ncbi:hypothetical protein [Kangiella sp.]|uniref:YqaA family protein n=1 Tax=Kangiella sp. TaxID=1920245 RepID=UPI0019C7FC45|nr:hypothetical protein [Kangiella sp.]MBD3654453.1 hypothetical protein [Kangiella sp.]
MKRSILAGGWGFAEATLFFILPDVLLSYYALDKKSQLIQLCSITLIGALLGGTLMYYWGQYHFATAYEWVESVPAISDELMVTVKDKMQSSGIWSIMTGPLQGLPYKTFAIQAYAAGISIEAFLLISIPARLLRFLAITYVARLIVRGLLNNLQSKQLVTIWAVVWVLVYGLYFYHFPS